MTSPQASPDAFELPEVPPERWRPLYDEAIAFHAQASWNWMSPLRLFAVSDPASGIEEMALGSIISPDAGGSPGIVAYLGDWGLTCLRRLLRDQIPPGRLGGLIHQRSLMLGFENSDVLGREDRQVIRDLGLRFRGRHRWPQFRSYLPGYMPWELDGDEVGFFTTILERARHFAARVQEDPASLDAPDLDESDLEAEHRLGAWLFERKSARSAWTERWQPLDFPAFEKIEPLEHDEVRIHRLKKALRKQPGEWELGLFALDELMDSGQMRPCVVQQVLMAHRETAELYTSDVFMCAERSLSLVPAILDGVEEAGVLPTCLVVEDPDLVDQLRPVLKKLGVGIRQGSDLEALEFARRSFDEFVRSRREEGQELYEDPDPEEV